ncbi:MAG: DUF3494 domain-containing protein [Solirubrobacterales bacterium]|nr:DUF3494 domain-containing protein [Solirubrobacterales bacterium]
MFNPTRPRRALRFGLAAFSLALVTVPVAAAQAAPVDLATAAPFAVLGGSTVTNTGPSVLNGDLGVAPGTAITGFPPGIVNGATHANDAVAQQAQSDLTTAYDVAAAQPVSPANDLTGTDLGNRTLQAGAYGFSSSAGLTGALTLDAAGDPNAQFVFVIGSTLTTAGASSVNLINGASPCNVFWKVGSSATIGTTTAFQGNVMALSDISVNDGATVRGRLLARNGQITLINDTIDNSMCAPPATTPPDTTPDSTPTDTAPTDSSPTGMTRPDSTPTGTAPAASQGDAGAVATPAGGGSGSDTRTTGTAQVPPTSRFRLITRRGTAKLRRVPRTRRSTTPRACRAGFTATVRGSMIRRVVFTLDGRRMAARTGSPFTTTVEATSGAHMLKARVWFKDATRVKTLKMGYRVCSTVALRPKRGPSQFTG